MSSYIAGIEKTQKHQQVLTVSRPPSDDKENVVSCSTKWQDHVKNVDIAAMTGLPNIADVIGKRRHALFGHIVRLDATAPAHQALKQVIATKAGHCPGTNWRRPGCPRKTWIQQIGDGTLASWRQTWQSAEERGHRGESSQRTTAVYALR